MDLLRQMRPVVLLTPCMQPSVPRGHRPEDILDDNVERQRAVPARFSESEYSQASCAGRGGKRVARRQWGTPVPRCGRGAAWQRQSRTQRRTMLSRWWLSVFLSSRERQCRMAACMPADSLGSSSFSSRSPPPCAMLLSSVILASKISAILAGGGMKGARKHKLAGGGHTRHDWAVDSKATRTAFLHLIAADDLEVVFETRRCVAFQYSARPFPLSGSCFGGYQRTAPSQSSSTSTRTGHDMVYFDEDFDTPPGHISHATL